MLATCLRRPSSRSSVISHPPCSGGGDSSECACARVRHAAGQPRARSAHAGATHAELVIREEDEAARVGRRVRVPQGCHGHEGDRGGDARVAYALQQRAGGCTAPFSSAKGPPSLTLLSLTMRSKIFTTPIAFTIPDKFCVEVNGAVQSAGDMMSPGPGPSAAVRIIA